MVAVEDVDPLRLRDSDCLEDILRLQRESNFAFELSLARFDREGMGFDLENARPTSVFEIGDDS